MFFASCVTQFSIFFDKIQDRDTLNMTAANFPSWLQEFQSSVQKTQCFLTCDKAEDHDGNDEVKENRTVEARVKV